MFALSTSMVRVSCYAIAEDARRHTIRLVSSVMRHFFNPKLDGIVVGIYVVYARRQTIICAILLHIHCAKDALKELIMYV